MKARLKSLPPAVALNAFLKRRKFRAEEQAMVRHYAALPAPDPSAGLYRLPGAPRGPVRHAFLVGTMEAQDRSGMLQALEAIFGRLPYFTKADGSYGLEFPLTAFDAALRQRNTRRLETLIDACDPAPNLVIGQMMGLNVYPALLKRLRQRGIVVVNIVMDDRLPDLWLPGPDGVRRGGIELATAVDITLTTCEDRVAWYHKEGAAARAMSLASDGGLIPGNLPRSIPISFIGNRYGYRSQIIAAVERAGLPVIAYGRGWPNGPVGAEAAALINASSRIILGSGLVGHMRDVYTLKLRDFDAMMSGACYVTHRNPDLLRMFTEGEHLYCYETLGELVAVLRARLADPEGTAATGARAQALIRANYTWDAVLRRTFDEIGLLI